MNQQKLQQVEKMVAAKKLTKREVDVFFLVGSGITNREAAEKIDVQPGTIKFHLTNIFDKLEVRSRSSVILMAHGLEPVDG